MCAKIMKQCEKSATPMHSQWPRGSFKKNIAIRSMNLILSVSMLELIVIKRQDILFCINKIIFQKLNCDQQWIANCQLRHNRSKRNRNIQQNVRFVLCLFKRFFEWRIHSVAASLRSKVKENTPFEKNKGTTGRSHTIY